MKNKFFVNRFLPILCIFLLVACFFTTNVFASSNLTANNGNSYNLPEFTEEMKKYDKYLIFVENGGKLFNLVFLVDNNGYFYNTTGGIFCYGRVLLCSTTGDSYYNTRYEVSSGTIAKLGGPITSASVFISSVDIYADANKNNIFFQKPLLGIKETLVVETEKAQIMEQIKIMIAGFLKYLIALVISVIAFYKGWKFLSMQLRKS